MMKKLIDKYPIGTYLKVEYDGDIFNGVVTEPINHKDDDNILDIIPDIPLDHSRYSRYGIHAVSKNEIIEVLKSFKHSFDDDLFEI